MTRSLVPAGTWAVLLAALSAVAPASAAVCLLELDASSGPILLKPADEPRMLRKTTPRERADRPLDVLHYDLELEVSHESLDLSGRVEVTLRPLEATDEIVLDLLNGDAAQNRVLSVTAPVLVDGVVRPHTHRDDLLTVALASTAAPTDTLTLVVEYAGQPPADFIMGYSLRYFPDASGQVDFDRPVIASLSEPDAARSWWPCHDHPFDAATVEVTVTCDERFTFAAPGLRTEDVALGDGRRRQTWTMSREIPSYLVSLAVAEYVSWEETMQVEHLVDPATGQSEVRTMPLQFFVPADVESAARFTWANTQEMITRFADTFGPYPYADIKYGKALFVFGGAMEHPTMSSMGHFTVSNTVDPDTGAPAGEWIAAHELIHQWFGDCVRVERWGEIWLNEGLARWGESYWFELKYGPEAGKRWLDRAWRISYPGALLDPDQLFGTTVYNKGAWVVHMLRRVVGDDAFFAALRNYLTDPGLRFGPVKSQDLQFHFEAIHGESLDWFFDAWLLRPGRPSLVVQPLQFGDRIELRVSQPADRTYRLPVPVRVRYEDGSSDSHTMWVGGVDGTEAGSISSFDARGRIVGVDVDPDRDFLLDARVSTGVLGRTAALLEPYPNPFNPQLNVRWFVGEAQRVRLTIHDVRGRRVRTLREGPMDEELYVEQWDGRDDDGDSLPSGVYFLRLDASSGVTETRKVTLLR